MPESNTQTLDRYGMLLSIGCAIHCAVLPMAMGLLTASGLGWIAGPEFEWAILACTFLIGSTQLIKSFTTHRNPLSLYLFGAGLTFFALAKLEAVQFQYSEAVLMTIGGLLTATAHFKNLRLCACCNAH
ncbi:MAG: MerC domain-containing protein [Acidobacteria bacterium]|nr:MerC domain-containing protein [Acidobacteriota bacterium]